MACSSRFYPSAYASLIFLWLLACGLPAPCHAHDAATKHKDAADGKLLTDAPADPRGAVVDIDAASGLESSELETSSPFPLAASITPQQEQRSHETKQLKRDAALEPRAIASASGKEAAAANGSTEAAVVGFDDPTPPREYRSPRRSLLPSGTVVKDETEELRSHVVRIRSQSNGEGSGVLLKKNFVLTGKRVVKGFLDPFEFTLQLGNETSHGLELFLHPSQDLAVIKLHPPFEHTGRTASAASPKGFFWPVLARDPAPPASLKLFGYGASTQSPTRDVLTYATFPLRAIRSAATATMRNHLVLSTKAATIAATSGDAGGPAFVVRKGGSWLAGVITTSKPRQAVVVSAAANREWVYDAMKSTCSREEQTFKRLRVGTDADVLIYYHCRVERAERLGLHLTSKSAPCAAGWKTVRLTSNHGKLLAEVDTRDKKDKDTIILTPKPLKGVPHFFIELWKPRLHDAKHTMISRYGPFNVSDYIDGGLYFEWCQS